MTFKIADLTLKQPDANGAIVERIYIRIDTLYAVYCTGERVAIQFADDPEFGAEQRKSLGELLVTRGTIDSYLATMRADPKLSGCVQRYERRLADALILALQGQTNQAVAEMERLHADLVEERRSTARQVSLIATLGAGLLLILLIAVLSLIDVGLSDTRRAEITNLWFAAAVGTVGAFFWTALAIRNREIEPGISKIDTTVDAGLRVIVGALSGALIFALIKAGAFGITIGDAIIGNNDSFDLRDEWMLVLVVAFVAGFLQHLVPDLLAKAAPSAGTGTRAAVSARSAAEDARSTERNPLGQGGEAAPVTVVAVPVEGADQAALAEEDEDDCCDRPGTPALQTEDVELPEALGGVEEEPLAA